MNVTYKMILGAMCSVLILGSTPKTAEAKQFPSAAQVEKDSDTLLSYPDTEDLKKQEEGQKPSEQELKEQIDLDNIMNPLPG